MVEEERADEALEEGRSADWYRNEARARASRALSLAGTAHNKLLNAIGNVGTDGEAPILSAMSKGQDELLKRFDKLYSTTRATSTASTTA